jgi:Phage tail lysozyme
VPQVIDAFLVEIGFDTSKLTEGQQKAVQALRGFEQSANQSSQRVQDNFGNNLRSLFRTLENPVAGFKDHLSDIATQSRRTGDSVAAGADAGAYALRGMAAAGLAAFAAVKGIQSVLDDLSKVKTEALQTSLAARIAGVPTNWISSQGLAANVGSAGQAPRQQTEGYLAALTESIAGFTTPGSPSFGQLGTTGPLAVLARNGISFLPQWLQQQQAAGEKPEAIIQKLLPMIQDLLARQPSEAAAQKLGSDLGIPNQYLTDVWRRGSGTNAAEAERLKNLGLSDKEVEAATKLGKAEAEAEAASTKLGYAMLYVLTPGLEAVLGVVTKVLTALSSFMEAHPTVASAVGWGVISAIPGGGAISALRGLAGGGASASLPPTGASTSGTSGTAAGPSGGAAPVGDSIEHAIDFFVGKGLTRAQATGIAARLAAESGRGVRIDPNAVNPGSGAYGAAQWLGSRKPAALATGGDLDRQLELLWSEFQGPESRAFRQIQAAQTAGQSAFAMETTERAGNPGFTEYAARLADSIYARGPAPATPPSGVVSLPNSGSLRERYNQAVSAFRAKGETGAPETFEAYATRIGDGGAGVTAPQSSPAWLAQAHANAVRTLNATGGSTTATTNNIDHGDINVGPIHVAPGTNPYQTGKEVEDAVRRARTATNFNTGQE